MKIRVVSDLHVDVNNSYPVDFKKSIKDKNVFTLIAGDICADPRNVKKWIKKTIKRGMFVAGNHLVYFRDDFCSMVTVNEFKQYLADAFPLSADVTFLDTSVNTYMKQIPDSDILVLGSTLYTDYKLVPPHLRMFGLTDKQIEKMNMNISHDVMNDFKWGYANDPYDNGRVERLLPDHYLEWHKQTMEKFKDAIEGNPDKEIIVLTHHCPSKRCMSEKWKDSTNNASFCSELDDFIIGHPNIKAWVCGHVHHSDSFKIGDCLVVMNPCGYKQYDTENAGYNPNKFIDTDTWTLI